MNNRTLVLSLGGSLIVPKAIDAGFLRRFKKIILDYVKRGARVIIICGGGSICRNYQKALRELNTKASQKDIDYLGIDVTRLNAALLQRIFGKSAESKIIENPTKKLSTKKKIIIGCGWNPGCSTDKDAVLVAKAFGIKTIVNLSNISFVYDKDPGKYKNAKFYTKLSWSALRKITGSRWTPGAHTPFDPLASQLAQKLGMKLVVMKGSDLKNLKRFLNGKSFYGTIVSNE